MPTAKKSASIDEHIKLASLNFAGEIAALVKAAIADEVEHILGAALNAPVHTVASRIGEADASPKRRGRPARKKRGPMPAAQKKALSEKMKARWAAKKKA